MVTQDLSISRDYVSDWGLTEAVREIFQNAIDQETEGSNKLYWEYDRDLKTLTIGNTNSVLERHTLLLGVSGKRNDSTKIGQFGEGYKLALLVLTRLGKPTTVFNRALGEVWKPRFKRANRLGGVEMLVIDIDKQIFKREKDNSLEFKIEEISEEEFEKLTAYNLRMQNYLVEHIATPHGNLLLGDSQKGRIYVGGLYVTSVDTEYGYDFKPGEITLNRDRNMLYSWDIFNTIGKIFETLDDPSLVEEAVKNNYPDVKYLSIEYSAKETVMEAAKSIAAHVKEEYGENVYPVASQAEAQKYLLQYPTIKPVVLPKKQVECCKLHGDFEKNLVKKDSSDEKVPKIYTDLMEWYDEYEWVLTDSGRTDFLEIVKGLIPPTSEEE